MCWKVFYIYWITFQTLLNVKLIYWKGLHINIIYTFNINLVYETYKNQNQGLITPKLALISLVLPKYNIELMKNFIIMASYNMDNVKYSYDNIILNYYQFIKSNQLEKYIFIFWKKLSIRFLKVQITLGYYSQCKIQYIFHFDFCPIIIGLVIFFHF